MTNKDRMDEAITEGNALMNKGDYLKAVDSYKKAVNALPCQRSYYLLGNALFSSNDYQGAKDSFKKALAHSKSFKDNVRTLEILLYLAKSESLLNNIKEALKHCKRGIVIGNGMLLQARNKEPIEKICMQFYQLRESPNDNSPSFIKCVTSFKDAMRELENKNYKAAIEMFNELLRKEVKKEILLRRGICYMELKDYIKALSSIEEAKNLKHNKDKLLVEILMNESLCLEHMGNYVTSIKRLEEALRIANEIKEQALSQEISNRLEKHKVIHTAPDVASEKAEALKLLKKFPSKLTLNDQFNVVAMSWFKKWKTAMHISDNNSTYFATEGKPLSKVGESPGYINNEDLLVKEEFLKDPEVEYENRPIRNELKQDKDFIIITTELWKIWEKIYGGYNITRCTFQEYGKASIDLYLQKLEVLFHPQVYEWIPKGKQVIYISRGTLAKSLIEKCTRILNSLNNSPQAKVIKLWKIEGNIELSNEGKKTAISDNEVINFNKILIELAGTISIVLTENICNSRNNHNKSSLVEGNNIERKGADEVNTLDYRSLSKIPFDKILPANCDKGQNGLMNIINSCYINSGIQCLSNCTELTKYFLLGYYKTDILNNKKSNTAIAYADIINKLWKGRKEIIKPYKLKEEIGKVAKQFKEITQQDSEEFVTCLLNELHDNIKREGKSIIMELFSCEINTKLLCPSCKHVLNRIENYLVISVPIPLYNVLVVTVIPKEISALPLRKEVPIQSNMTMADISSKLGMSKQFLYKFLREGQVIRNIPETADPAEVANEIHNLYAFECLFAEEEKISNTKVAYYPLVIQVEIAKPMYSYGRVTRSKRPLILFVPRNMTLLELKVEIFHRLSPYFKEFTGKTRKEVERAIPTLRRQRDPVFRLDIVVGNGKCEFCGTFHLSNCEFSFNEEEKCTLEDMIKRKKDLVLSLVMKDTEGAGKLMKCLNAEPNNKSLKERSKKDITLYDCFDAFSKEEQLDRANLWDCENCKSKVQVIKSATLCTLPPILIIHLKRFKQKIFYHHSTSKKIEEYVEYPIEGLQLEGYVDEKYKGKAKYNLFAVTNHIGGTAGGHYTAICKNSINNLWTEFDDDRLTKATESDIVSKYGYILYYRRADL